MLSRVTQASDTDPGRRAVAGGADARGPAPPGRGPHPHGPARRDRRGHPADRGPARLRHRLRAAPGRPRPARPAARGRRDGAQQARRRRLRRRAAGRLRRGRHDPARRRVGAVRRAPAARGQPRPRRLPGRGRVVGDRQHRRADRRPLLDGRGALHGPGHPPRVRGRRGRLALLRHQRGLHREGGPRADARGARRGRRPAAVAVGLRRGAAGHARPARPPTRSPPAAR